MPDDGADEEQDKVLIASVNDVRYLIALLRGVGFANRAVMSVAENGLSVAVEESRTLLATAYIFKGLFNEFNYHPELPQDAGDHDEQEQEVPNISFEIQLQTLIECMNIFGTAGGSAIPSGNKYRRWHQDANSDNENDRGEGASNRSNNRSNKTPANGRIDQYFGHEKGTGMRLTYAGSGFPLTLLIAEDSNGPTATCEITTFEADPMLSLDFLEYPTVMKIILKSSWLRDALSEIDQSCEKLTIICNPPPPAGRSAKIVAPPRLRLQAVGNFGSVEMDYPSDKEVLESCECDEQVSFSYRFSHISRTQRALQSSTKTSLRINEEGLLSLQLLMPTPRTRESGSSDGFIEFRCLPLDEEI
ncbi:uncharacterized protein FIBRA_08025 [Fibroporia radiculosa]|uniref:Rad1-domain-containing protein n=1 Tax=Fibroporia radiculosa TaxID=599839 RepID=J4I1Y4_9APHY|nr:uncharacterized protein FIBRA_08025 [Fibroporia radiculosa]CCM05792.1 predicted protein [Fibroporia radiculosa]